MIQSPSSSSSSSSECRHPSSLPRLNILLVSDFFYPKVAGYCFGPTFSQFGVFESSKKMTFYPAKTFNFIGEL
jgi:hypothetical protein